MKKSYYVTAVVLSLLITTALVSVTTFAASDNGNKPAWLEKRQEVRQAIVNGDYDAWASAMQEKVQTMHDRADELESNITLERFEQLQQVHQLIQDGQKDEAKELMAELGLKGFGPRVKGFKRGFHQGFQHGINQ